MEWEECLKSDVHAVSKNAEIARGLLKLCEARLEVASLMDKKKHPALRAESYYEIIKELVTAMLALDGYKSYSHVCLVAYLKEFRSNEFSANELELVDMLRRIRNDLDYRGTFIGADFMERNEKSILTVITKMKNMVEKEVK